MALAQRQGNPQEDELPECAHKTRQKGDKGEGPNGDGHSLFRSHLVSQITGRKLGKGVTEEEDRAQPSNLDGGETKVFLDKRKKGMDCDAVKLVK